MVTLALLLAVLVTFSGTFLLVWLARTRRGDGLLYGAVTLVLIVNTALITLYHFEELVLLLASHPLASEVLIDVAVALKVAAKAGVLALLVSKAVQSVRRRSWRVVVPGVWVVISLLPLPAWVGELTFLGLAVLPVWRLWPGSWGAYFPLKALVILIDAFQPQGLSPFWGVGLDLGFYLALNLVLHRRVLGGQQEAKAPCPRDWTPFELSPREQETAELLIDRMAYKEIAARLFVSVDTIKSHSKAVYRKTGCRNRDELARKVGTHP